ncbi:MAG: hypothetical protein WC986_13585 [Elusimicrobiota bacterium]
MTREALPRIEGVTLIVPLDCPLRYRWWDETLPDEGRLTLCAILRQLGASMEMHRAYCPGCDEEVGPA